MAGAALLASALLLHTFKEDVRDGAVAEGAIVTSRTISDKRVQAAAELVAKEVALDLLSNPQVTNKNGCFTAALLYICLISDLLSNLQTIRSAAAFVTEVLQDDKTRKSAGELVVQLFKDEAMLRYTQVP
jgi:hypothetical protein